MARIELTRSQILARLQVDINTGVCAWVDATKQHRSLVGCIAGCPVVGRNGKAYWRIKINGVPYHRSHLVFVVAYDEWPTLELDHISGNSIDDRVTNLRQCTHLQNMKNIRTMHKSSALPMGVRCMGHRFNARITCDRRQINIGWFDNPQEAHIAYMVKRKELFGEFS